MTRNNSRRASFEAYCTFYAKSSLLDRIEPGIDMARIWNFNGVRKDEWISPHLYLLFKGQTEVFLSYLYTREKYKGIEFDRMDRSEFNLDSQFSDPLKLGFWVSIGSHIARNEDPPVVGNGFDFEAWMDLKPLDRLLIESHYRFSKLTRQDDGSAHDYHDFESAGGLAETSRQFFLKFQYLFRM